VALSEISCEEVLDQIELYIDGELDPVVGAHLAEHLGSCSPCLRRAEFQAKLKEILRRKCAATEAPGHLVVRIRTIIRSERRPVD
jgi:mycothiol system anti-sigma-R factor